MDIIAERQEEVDAIHSEIFSERQRRRSAQCVPATPSMPTNLDDATLLGKARNAKDGAKFAALQDRGDWKGLGYPSQSEADLWLAGKLAFWTGRDRARIDSLFRRSALIRAKWARPDYRERTLDEAINGCTDVYTPRQARTKGQVRKRVGKSEKWTAARIAASLKDHFAQDEGGKLYVFRDGCYRAKGEEYVRTRVRKIVPGEEWKSQLANETVEFTRVGAPLLWERPPADKLNLQNGLLKLNTLALDRHSPDHLSPVQLPLSYDPLATCPEWERQVAATFPEDAMRAGVPWQIVAWLMLPHTSIQKALLLLGPGGTGKSTFLTALLNFLGRHRNVSTLSLQKLESDRFAPARLVGKLANICADLPSTHLETSSVFKQITGGDRIVAEYKFRDSFDFTPFVRLIFSANQPPRSKDATEAFFQRWYVLPFVNVFRGAQSEIKREELDAKLAAPGELSGVLNKALAALPGLRKQGLTITAAVRNAQEEFWKTTDPLSIWLLRNTVDLPNAVVPRSVLINSYNAAAAKEGRAGMTETNFGLELKRLRPGVKDVQRNVAGKPRTWCYLGISLVASYHEAEGQNVG